MRRIVIAVTVIALVSVSACSAGNPAPTVAPASVAATPTTPATVADARAAEACRLTAQAAETEKGMMEDGVALAIYDAAKGSPETEIAEAAEAMMDRYRLAVLSKGTEDALSTELELTTAEIKLRTACIKAGLDKG